ncbi:hypothetical protein ENUP19_0061G0108 [Entamoeba nuttalli]|uniref:Uncharacterized protein n=1 Tax=Entamoeba nuttalli TaxID=412467 RepID=A0ABQ0DDM4_9EUKA
MQTRRKTCVIGQSKDIQCIPDMYVVGIDSDTTADDEIFSIINHCSPVHEFVTVDENNEFIVSRLPSVSTPIPERSIKPLPKNITSHSN